MAAKILKHERAERYHFQNLTVKNQKPLLLKTLNEQAFFRLIKLHFCMSYNAGYFNKANQRYAFFDSSFKKIASKIDKH